MRSRWPALVVALALVGGLFVFLAGRPGGPDPDAEPARAPPPADTTEIVRSRLAARASGEVVASPCSAAGRVVDAGSGRGIAGALVLLRPGGLGEPASGASDAPITAHTDAGGQWSVPRLAPGRYLLSGSAPGFLPAIRGDLALAPGVANPGLDLALAPGGHPLRGTVSDISGGPVEGAIVAIDREDEGNVITFNRASIPAISDADGRFTVQVADGLYEVSAWHPDYASDTELGVDIDLGTVRGIAAAGLTKAERGDLGLRTKVATAAYRPRPEGEQAEPPAEKDDPDAPKRLWVRAVTVDGPADKAGIQPGDEIVAIDGHPVASIGTGNALRLLWTNNLRRGQTVVVEVARADNRQTFTLDALGPNP